MSRFWNYIEGTLLYSVLAAGSLVFHHIDLGTYNVMLLNH